MSIFSAGEVASHRTIRTAPPLEDRDEHHNVVRVVKLHPPRVHSDTLFWRLWVLSAARYRRFGSAQLLS